MSERGAHTAEVTEGLVNWLVICTECSAEAADYVYPCRAGGWRKVPPHSLTAAAERDAARAELAALRQRIETLCATWPDGSITGQWPTVVSVAALRAALAGATPRTDHAADEECAECGETVEHHGPIPFVPKPADDYTNPEEWEVGAAGTAPEQWREIPRPRLPPPRVVETVEQLIACGWTVLHIATHVGVPAATVNRIRARMDAANNEPDMLAAGAYTHNRQARAATGARGPQPHGTTAAYHRHRRYGQRPCPDCRAAYAQARALKRGRGGGVA